MTEIRIRRPPPRTRQAAEGLPRWRWTTAELIQLGDLGVFTAEDRFELLGGEIVPASPAGRRHEVVREDLEELLRARISPDVRVVAEPQFNLDEATFTEPDILVRPADIRSPDVRGPTALLVIEIADSSLVYDHQTKAPLYAAHGVREYWVINARTLETTVHRDPGASGYSHIVAVPADERLIPMLAPTLAVRLDELELD